MATFVRSNHVKFSLKMPHWQASLFHTQFPSIFSKLSPPDPFLPRASLFFKSLLARPFISTCDKTVSSQTNRGSRLTMAQQHLELLMAGLPDSEAKHLDLRFRELGIADQEACSVVETRAFMNPEHRCTPEKFKYRLTNCSAISYGLFIVLNPDHKGRLSKLDPGMLEKLTNQEDSASQKLALVAHAVSTLGTSPVVTDEDMAFPKNWRDAQPNGVGHKAHGRTVCLHSLAILPEFQGLGLGPLLMNTYLGFLNEARIADRAALLCEERLVPFYEKLGFKFLGPSSAQFGGGGWYDMVHDFKDTVDAKATPS